MPVALAPAATATVAAAAPVAVGPPPAMPAMPVVVDQRLDPGGPERLPDLARRAALNAERDAIQQALDHFRWNRRKAAQQLGVSYKTLLNKMKECGISAPSE
jgi:DNA-binding NtrC family response regulator